MASASLVGSFSIATMTPPVAVCDSSLAWRIFPKVLQLLLRLRLTRLFLPHQRHFLLCPQSSSYMPQPMKPPLQRSLYLLETSREVVRHRRVPGSHVAGEPRLFLPDQ